jgi:exopolyphosphatase / guanosine-5'-triphosphate,3'-diphosphate pyrophosphatase
MAEPSVLAAVDLGSNSFRMEIGRVVGSQIYTLDSIREPVRLASGLTKEKLLGREAFQRGLTVVDRFGERLRGFAPRDVRAVATNTLRVARNAKDFLAEAERKLGFPIEVIAGREEARLIYFGVAHLQEPGDGRRLLVDIGGGSTELIVGAGYRPEIMESVYVGCVGYSMRYFPGELCTKAAFREAELSARHQFEVVSKTLRRKGWTEAIGSSGTARALADILEENGFSDHGITAAGLDELKAAMIRATRTSDLRLAGLKQDRIPVLPGGLSIMTAAFAELAIERMTVSDGGLRTGVLYDLLGRTRHEDMRDTTVREFMQRYGVDEAQAQRVAQLAAQFWYSLSEERPSDLQEKGGADGTDRVLSWAAQLHEIGLSISHNGYHKHSAYILSNADMPGFSRKEQTTLAMLVLGHTGKLAKMKDYLEADDDWRPLVCLRLAAVVFRSRIDAPVPKLTLRQDKWRLMMEVPVKWLEANPLTEYDLRQEIDELAKFGIALEISTTASAKLASSPKLGSDSNSTTPDPV